ncbi:type IV pilus biogenesis protein PilP [Prodigiosinella confusarubida]|uniref:Type IV pilus biogenesis protein PilP n=1 Tax=Serratia sp. (strain ATCC 39006) TaxID=104623 RepID=A0A2I5TBE8_SERS3|nr:type IV pilus biogenesis protein PilP [Serratia sp. ATCC 39006]AUH01900.1 type IV pilus biogenesis protein PilP [Serratia sp. ATCC 39006]AUH06222.1 type IV pilus biogenesis protein PilP [Serratia sp. ATCC 39006]
MHNVNSACRLWLLGILAVFSQQSLAEDRPASADADNVTIGQLEAIQSRNFLLEQQVQTARLKRQLRESQSESQVSQAANVPASLPFMPSNPLSMNVGQSAAGATSSKRVMGAIRLQEIYGRGTQLHARIVLPQGGITEVSAGDLLPGSKLSVTSVTLNAVKLSDGTALSF